MTRSPMLMNADDTAVLVIDVQQRLLPVMSQPAQLVNNIERLLTGATALGVRCLATEQRPDKLGSTHPALASYLPDRPSKSLFSCRECASAFDAWHAAGVTRVLLVGMETHVCVQQTAFDLLADGFWVYVATDAVTSRYEVDRDTALQRMHSSGVTLTTTESALFEWCEGAEHPQFRTISNLAKDR